MSPDAPADEDRFAEEEHAQDGPAARWFARFTWGLRMALPPRIRRLVPVTFIGYAMINGSAFLLDMGILRAVDVLVPEGVSATAELPDGTVQVLSSGAHTLTSA